MVRIYSNGFLLNNEEALRRYNRDTVTFLQDLKDGIIPKEILDRCDEDVNIVLEHHLYLKPDLLCRDETYVFSPKPFNVPMTLDQMTVAQSKTPPLTPGTPGTPVPPPKIDPSLPKASMKIRLMSGKAVNVEFNSSSRIEELYAYVGEQVNMLSHR